MADKTSICFQRSGVLQIKNLSITGNFKHKGNLISWNKPSMGQKKWRGVFFRTPSPLKRFLSLKIQNFAVKWNCKNRFNFSQKNSEYYYFWWEIFFSYIMRKWNISKSKKVHLKSYVQLLRCTSKLKFCFVYILAKRFNYTPQSFRRSAMSAVARHSTVSAAP